MNTKTILALLVGLLFAAPVASAAHDDPTHGVVPHSVSDSPLDVHPVALSTPHPYALGEVYTFEITAEGADSVRVHFENYDVNGYYSFWLGSCYGSELTILDANTGLELDSFCGAQSADWWTPDYETNALVLVLETASGGWGSDLYGFDIYEVVTNGAEVLASVPRAESVNAQVYPNANVNVDPNDLESTESRVNAVVRLDAGVVNVDQNGQLQYGSFWDCSLYCTQVDGFKLNQDLGFRVGDEHVTVSASLVGTKNADAPGGYDLQGPTVDCQHNKESC